MSWSVPRLGSRPRAAVSDAVTWHSQEQGRRCPEEKKQSFRSVSQGVQVNEGRYRNRLQDHSSDRDTIKSYLEITEIKGRGP